MTDFAVQHRPDATSIVLAFASGGEDFRHEIPSFEWRNTLHALPVSFILLRDMRERWYQDGIEGLGDRVGVIQWLWKECAPYKRTVGLGLSSGAYGALLFGQLVPFTEVIAISPLTMLGADAEKAFGPTWAHRVRLPPHQANFDINLQPLYAGGPIPKIRAFVTDGDGAELDETMCRLIGIEDVMMIRGHTHAGLAPHMRDQGLVQKLILGES